MLCVDLFQYDLNFRFRVEEFHVTGDAKPKVQRRSRKLGDWSMHSRVLTKELPEPAATTSDEFDVDTCSTLRPSHASPGTISTELSTRPIPILKEPVWTDMQVDQEDSRYFHFFLWHGGESMIYAELFPCAIQEIFARTAMSKTLQRSVLAVSSMAVDGSLQRPLVRALTHKTTAINLLQKSLSTGDITEEVAISIFLMLYMDCFQGKAVSQGHLRGFYLVLKHVFVNIDDPFTWKNISPVLMLIWRTAISIDSLTSSVQRTPPVLPAVPFSTNQYHVPWATSLSKDVRSVNLALALFALEDLFHRANHWLRDCEAVMSSPEFIENPQNQAAYNVVVEQRVQMLRQEHAKWAQLPACALAMQIEQDAQSLLSDQHSHIPRFLDYPPVVLYDRTFAIVLNGWRLMALVISVFPVQGGPQHSLSDIHHAIEICRTHVALELLPSSRDQLPEFFAVLLAGRTFMGGRQYKREFEWAFEEIAKMDAMHHGTLSQMQGFVDRVKDFKMFNIPEWDISENLSLEG